MKYSEYFDIDPNYYPEVNPDSIKEKKIRWEYTYPHKTFVALLETAERMLARGRGPDKHGIWVEGSYGTGKSRTIWTLQNLLTCSEREFVDYFDRFETLRKKPDLKDNLLGQREEGRIVIVSRYGSGEIQSIRQFMKAVFDSVTKALKDAGIDYQGNRTFRGKIAAWLEDEIHKGFFDQLIQKPIYRGKGSFNGRTADDIIALLNNSRVGVDTLLDDIIDLADNEGITAFEISMDDLKVWLTDIIDTNKLKAIVFFWDEFSSFFKWNKNSLDSFQKLAELSNDKPFYLVIATHMSGSLVTPGEINDKKGSFSAVYDRFLHVTIEMPDDVAFELIHDAMKVKEFLKEDYDDLTSELNGLMAVPRKAVCDFSGVADSILSGLFPIHPMAALLLKYIATSFASNQRSMFNFIKNEDSNKLQAFQWFIKTYSPDDGDVLTIDYLWNFFYERGTDENTSGIGRSNLDVAIATILDTYSGNENKLSSMDEKRVLKTVLMMQAISKKLNNGVEILRPTARNIRFAFAGDDTMDNNRAVNLIINQLVPKKILYVDSDGSVEEYAAAAVAGDQVQIDAIKDRLRKELKTAVLLNVGEFEHALALPVSIRARYVFESVTVDNFKIKINKITNERETYQFYAVICYARNEEEQKRMRTLIAEAVKDVLYRKIVFIDVSAIIMGADNVERYIDVAAQEEYWRPKDSKLADKKLESVSEILGEWKREIGKGPFLVYKGGEDERQEFKKPAGSVALLNEVLASLVLSIYPLSFDNAKVSENFFTGGKYPQGAKLGINRGFGGIFQEKSVRAVLGETLGTANYWDVYKTHGISKLKVKVDEFISERFKKDVRISIGEIFDFLMTQGFMPCDLYAYLTGFLLKEYADEPYRYGIGTAGDDGGKMTPEKLGEYIGEYIKHKNKAISNYKEKYIEIMTQDQKVFVDFAHSAFDVPENLSVEQAASRLRVKLKNLGYPIWCFKTIDTNDLSVFIDKLAEIANSKSGVSVPTTAGEMGKMLRHVPTASANLTNLLTTGNGVKAMREYLQTFENGDILKIAVDIGVQDVMGDVKRQIASGEASWLWDKETGDEELRKLLVEYRIIQKSAAVSIRETSFFQCMQSWKLYTYTLKMPCTIFKGKMPELGYFFDCLKTIVTEGDLPYDRCQKFLLELETKTEIIAAVKEKRVEIFKDEYSIYIGGFSEEDISKLYNALPGTSFMDDRSAYERKVQAEAEVIRGEQDRFRLLEMWERLTGTKSPYEWCDKYQTPILVMVPQNEQQNASKLFRAVNYGNDKKETVFALDYLSKNPAFILDLQDTAKIEAAFTSRIVGRYASVLKDNDAVRKHLRDFVPADGVYQWYGSPVVRDEITKLARKNYMNGGNDAVMKRIDEMAPDEAKYLLKQLVADDVEVGISIINKEGE